MRRALLLSLAVLVAPPVAAETQIRGVTLSTAGLALIEAEASLEDGALSLPFRRSEVDHVLRSLRVEDPLRAPMTLRLEGPGAFEDTFASLPFEPEALRDLSVLIAAMVGAQATFERDDTTRTGTLMGLRPVICEESGLPGCDVLSLRTPGGVLVQLPFDAATQIRFTDPADQAAIERGLAALRADARRQVIELRLDSRNPQDRFIEFAWLQPAPVWQTAWRATTRPDGVELTGWAVLENATTRDWNDITLTLATGAIQRLDVPLYTRLGPDAVTPALKLDMRMDAPMAMESMAPAVAPPLLDDRDSFSRYTLPEPITLPAGEMISLPFLSERIEDARQTLYRGGSGRAHPVITLEIENPLPLRLPAGVLTLFEAGGHAGDAMIPELAPGARERVEFAQDTAVSVREESAEEVALQSTRITDGILVAEDRTERSTRYRIEAPPEADRTLTLLHPLRAGWEMQTAGGTVELDATRFTLDLPAGTLTTHEVVESRVTVTRIALLDLDREALARWSGRVPDDATREILLQLQHLRAREVDLRRDRARLIETEAELIEDQSRLAGLIEQLGEDSGATADRRARVDAIDAEISELRTERARIDQDLDALDTALRDLLRGSD